EHAEPRHHGTAGEGVRADPRRAWRQEQARGRRGFDRGRAGGAAQGLLPARRLGARDAGASARRPETQGGNAPPGPTRNQRTAAPVSWLVQTTAFSAFTTGGALAASSGLSRSPTRAAKSAPTNTAATANPTATVRMCVGRSAPTREWLMGCLRAEREAQS